MTTSSRQNRRNRGRHLVPRGRRLTPNRHLGGARARCAVLAVLAVCLGLVQAPAAFASTANSAAFAGGSGTVVVGGALYAKQGGALTLTVNTSSDTQCVDVAGAFTAHQQSAIGKSTWTFPLNAPAGNGAQAVTATASPSFNKNNVCTGPSSSTQASYTLDNTGPTVTAATTPAANAAGWNNSNTSVTWSATDVGGSGVASGPTPSSSNETANGIVTRISTATDRLGNVGTGSVTVRIDKVAPTITATQTSAGYGQPTTVTFTCDDPHATGVQASGVASCVADGTNPASNSITIPGNGTVTGTATDAAGNTATASVQVRNVDTTPPTLSGSPTRSPNGNGWYNGDVTVHWTAGDPESGVPVPPGDTTISGEGTGLTSSTAVTNGAGLQTTATSTPAVNIDRTAPTTGINGVSNVWANGDVTVTLTPTDNLSGVASTTYTIDGGPRQSGTSFTLSAEGQHTISYSSTDKAGNTESMQTATVRIDKTAPTIGHHFAPQGYHDGAWTNQDVTVTFDCTDQGGSGLASCTNPVSKSSEGAAQQVTGTATDNAGNSATDTATVSIDKTPPTISAQVDRDANAAGWFNDDVTVSFTCADRLSGVSSCPDSVRLGEGANQSVSRTVSDAAGNQASDDLSGINVDKTAPSLDGSAPNGWHSDDVTVTWSASDALSGLAGGVPAPSVVTGEGANLTATTSVSDKAGNATTTTVDGIMIDRTAPTTQAAASDPRDSGWYADSAQVTLTARDNLSGIAATYYSVDGQPRTLYSGPFSVNGDGTHEVSFWSVDNAGNIEQAGAPLDLPIDGAAPTTSVIYPISPDSGWFVTSGIPVAFDAADGDPAVGSGVAATYYAIDGGATQVYGEPFTADLSTGTHTITYWSVDLAGNVEAKQNMDINVDTVPPVITGAATPAPNSFGWNNTDVQVAFHCTDVGSGLATGVAGCAGDTTLTNDGGGQSVHGDAIDVAGNRSSTDVGPINIDTTAPTLTGAATADPNGAGWYNHDVTIQWSGVDRLSGIDPATQPGATTITGEGSNLSAGPVTIADKAGNVSAPASVTGIKIDRTSPTVTGGPTTQPNAAGWYRGDVVVDFSCIDNLSGVALCPTSKLVKGNGAGQSVTSAPALDKAGNASAGYTVSGINIDGAAPTTKADNRCTLNNGWCTGSTATVVLTATDQQGLSGVKEIHYSVNGGAEQVAAGATKSVSVPLDGSGVASLSYYAVDNAGNVEPTNDTALQYDNIAPAVTHTLSPVPNGGGWDNSDVVVHFNATDNDAGSGVDPSTVTPDVTISQETSGRLVTGTAADTAGNVGSDSVIVKLDKTPPSISGAVVSGAQGDNGWYVGPVGVHFSCDDALSGVVTCPDNVLLTKNGSNTATGTAFDKAGNSSSTSLSGINIDQEKPTITGVNVNGQSYTLGAVPSPTCTATDDISGLASCGVTVTGGTANGVGTFSYTATAKDKAGNVSVQTGTYSVIYRFDGFLQPINDTAHQTGLSTSVFKAGSTIPVKFQLKNAAGGVVQAGTAPVWLTPVKGSAMSAPVDESSYAAAGDSGTTFRYDTTANQYIYNYKSGAGGNYWRIGVKLDDGQTYYVNIGLR